VTLNEMLDSLAVANAEQLAKFDAWAATKPRSDFLEVAQWAADYRRYELNPEGSSDAVHCS